MRRRRAFREFERLGGIRAQSLGLSARRSRQLELVSAWGRTAGERLARLARPVRIRRGTVEFEWLDADPERRRELLDALPALAARLAAEMPGRRIERLRLEHPEIGVRSVAAASGPTATAAGPRPASPEQAPGDRTATGPVALEELMERYLERAKRQKPERTVRSQAVRSSP